MFAMRLARGFTGRPKIARMEGGYHGTHDYAEVSTHPLVTEAAPAAGAGPTPDAPGAPPRVLRQTVVVALHTPHAPPAVTRPHHTPPVAGLLAPHLRPRAVG